MNQILIHLAIHRCGYYHQVSERFFPTNRAEVPDNVSDLEYIPRRRYSVLEDEELETIVPVADHQPSVVEKTAEVCS